MNSRTTLTSAKRWLRYDETCRDVATTGFNRAKQAFIDEDTLEDLLRLK